MTRLTPGEPGVSRRRQSLIRILSHPDASTAAHRRPSRLGAGDDVNIAGDVQCPTCGPVITCPHVGFQVPPRPAHDSANAPAWTDDFIENLRREDAAHTETRAAAEHVHRTRPAAAAAPGGNPAYVRAAIGRELETLAAATPGSRNHTLNMVAFNVFGFVKGGHADKQACWAELERIANAIGLHDREIRGTLASAWKASEARQVPARVVEL